MRSSCRRRRPSWSTVVTTVTAAKIALSLGTSPFLRSSTRIFVSVYCTKIPEAISASFLDIVSF